MKISRKWAIGLDLPQEKCAKPEADERNTDSALYSKCVTAYSQKQVSMNTPLVSLLLQPTVFFTV